MTPPRRPETRRRRRFRRAGRCRPNMAMRDQPRLGGLVEHRCRDRTGEHRVDADARRGEFGGGGLGQAPQRPLRRAVGGVLREGADRSGAADVDDGRMLGRAQLIERGADTEEGAQTVDPPSVFEVLGRLVGQRRPVQHAGVVDQRAQRPESVDDLLRPPSSHCSGEVTSSSTAITSSSPSSPTAATSSSARRSQAATE